MLLTIAASLRAMRTGKRTLRLCLPGSDAAFFFGRVLLAQAFVPADGARARKLLDDGCLPAQVPWLIRHSGPSPQHISCNCDTANLCSCPV